MGSVFYIRVSQSALLMKSAYRNTQQRRKLSTSSKDGPDTESCESAFGAEC